MNLGTLFSIINSNNGTAQYELASALFNGDAVNVEASREEAFSLFASAAKHNSSKAQFVVATAYFNGLHVESDPEKGYALLQESAKGGSPKAMLDLAEILLTGKRGEYSFEHEQNHEKAFELYSHLDDAIGNTIAQFRLAQMYANGLHVKQNVDQAAQYYSKVINNDSQNTPTNIKFIALKELGYLYLEGTEVIDANTSKAVDLHLEALSLLTGSDHRAYPHAKVMEYEIGCKLMLGDGIEKSEQQGFDLLHNAATHGHVQARIAVALAYEQGLYGIKKDVAEALTILSTMNNNVDVQKLLSELKEAINNQKPVDHGDYTFEKALGYDTEEPAVVAVEEDVAKTPVDADAAPAVTEEAVPADGEEKGDAKNDATPDAADVEEEGDVAAEEETPAATKKDAVLATEVAVEAPVDADTLGDEAVEVATKGGDVDADTLGAKVVVEEDDAPNAAALDADTSGDEAVEVATEGGDVDVEEGAVVEVATTTLDTKVVADTEEAAVKAPVDADAAPAVTEEVVPADGKEEDDADATTPDADAVIPTDIAEDAVEAPVDADADTDELALDVPAAEDEKAVTPSVVKDATTTVPVSADETEAVVSVTPEAVVLVDGEEEGGADATTPNADAVVPTDNAEDAVEAPVDAEEDEEAQIPAPSDLPELDAASMAGLQTNTTTSDLDA